MGREPGTARGAHTRESSLDGLRGLAALCVVVCHAVFASQSSGLLIRTGPWFLIWSPLHILWAGQEMVVIFFVLSGYVLALPAAKRSWGWFDGSYYPRRLLRLYVPVCAALVLAGVLHALVARRYVPGASLWLNAHAVPLSPIDGLQDASLLHQPGPMQYMPVIWSLKYEVEFSLLLPVMLAIPILTRARPRLATLAALCCVLLVPWGAATGHLEVAYLPMFVLGSLLAFHAPRLRDGPWLPRLIPAVILLTMGSWVENSPGGQMVMVLAACLTVSLAIGANPVSTALRSRGPKWLGQRSYSLYLVHEPIVVTIAFLVGGRPQAVPLLLVALPVSLLAADLFWRAIERPAVGLARSAGRSTAVVVGKASLRRSRPDVRPAL